MRKYDLLRKRKEMLEHKTQGTLIHRQPQGNLKTDSLKSGEHCHPKKLLPYGGTGCAGRGVPCLVLLLLPPPPPRPPLPAAGTLSPGSPVSASGRAHAHSPLHTHTHTHTLTHSLTPATATRARTRPPSPAGNFSGRGSFVAPAAAALRFCESSGVTVRVVCPFGAVLCGSLRARHAGPRRRSPSPEAAAPEARRTPGSAVGGSGSPAGAAAEAGARGAGTQELGRDGAAGLPQPGPGSRIWLPAGRCGRRSRKPVGWKRGPDRLRNLPRGGLTPGLLLREPGGHGEKQNPRQKPVACPAERVILWALARNTETRRRTDPSETAPGEHRRRRGARGEAAVGCPGLGVGSVSIPSRARRPPGVVLLGFAGVNCESPSTNFLEPMTHEVLSTLTPSEGSSHEVEEAVRVPLGVRQSQTPRIQ
ncbi:uncharacterized protein LOC122490979 [Prionailurus bengalensis]|uniref:uncharacterized protein LOC122490979 n=1 Tax=Prionailurus bengalensis TaxID=37029 RepID=UPI001CA9F7D0|nr:uncharacterized protein LOC122490979 [Prionailurus bengalensis]